MLLAANAAGTIAASAYNNNWFSNNPQSLSYAISGHYRNERIHLLYLDSVHPFRDDVDLNFRHTTLHLYQKFLMPPAFSDERIGSLDASVLAKRPGADVQVLYVKKTALGRQNDLQRLGYKLKWRSVPAICDEWFSRGGTFDEYNDWVYYVFELR